MIGYLTSILNERTRWLLIHLIGNLIISGLTVENTYYTLTQPETSMIPLGYFNPAIQIMMAMHVYHCLFYSVSREDLFDHIVYIFFLSTFGIIWDWGRVVDGLLFFMCGLPGAIDYFALIVFPGKTETSLNEAITLYFRSPFMSVIIYIFCTNQSIVPNYVLIMTAFLCLYNTQSHTKKTVLNNQPVKEKYIIEQTHPCKDYSQFVVLSKGTVCTDQQSNN